jgi:hypothetical protein
MVETENTYRWGRLSTVDLLIKVACFVSKVNNMFIIKTAYLNLAVQGGQPYCAFHFSKAFLVEVT